MTLLNAVRPLDFSGNYTTRGLDVQMVLYVF